MTATTSPLVPGLLGLVLIGVALVEHRWVSPTVGGQFFDRHPNLRTFQRLFAPISIALLGSALLVLALIGLTFGNWLDLNATGPGHFPGSLLWAVPKAGSTATFDNLAGRDAQYLNATDNGAYNGQHLNYVAPSVASTGPTVISVHAINQYTWAAVALDNGTCYGILTAEDPSHPAYGSTYYTRFAHGSPCQGSAANRQTVKSVSTPS